VSEILKAQIISDIEGIVAGMEVNSKLRGYIPTKPITPHDTQARYREGQEGQGEEGQHTKSIVWPCLTQVSHLCAIVIVAYLQKLRGYAVLEYRRGGKWDCSDY
jgi:hypothetical protein